MPSRARSLIRWTSMLTVLGLSVLSGPAPLRAEEPVQKKEVVRPKSSDKPGEKKEPADAKPEDKKEDGDDKKEAKDGKGEKKDETPVVKSDKKPDYLIQAEDVISIRVSGEPQLSTNYRVDEEGDITMEMLGKVHVAGLTSKQLEEKLTKDLGKFLKLFEVKCFVVGETGSRVLVYGEVVRPGMAKVRTGGKLLDVLAEVGGPGPNADTKRITISRKSGGKPETVDLEEVLKDPDLNLPIGPGDTITVPGKNVRSVRIDGEVRMPGLKALDDVKTAYTAVRAAGPSANADWTRIALRRKNSSIPVILDLSGVRTGRLKDDFALEEGDELTVLSRFSGTATIRGEVKTPGEKELNGETQLWDFILTAGGGLGEKADRRHVQVIRDGKTTIVDIAAIAEGRKRADDPALEVRPDDVIFVPIGVAVLRGEVKTPGERPLGTTTNVLDFILSQGGGFTEKADRRKVAVKRDGKIVKEINLSERALEASSNEEVEFELHSGDIVMIPNDESQRFAIVGGVRKPGTFPVKQNMTLLDAITMAEGFSERAKKKTFVVAPGERFDKDGNLKTAGGGTLDAENAKKLKPKKGEGEDDLRAMGLLVIDYKKLLAGDPTQNVTVRPGDRILIPELPPPDTRQRKMTIFESALRLVPFAGMFMGLPGYGYGYGGW